MQLRKSTRQATIVSKNLADQEAARVEEKRARRRQQPKCPKQTIESRVLTTRRHSRQYCVLADYTLESSDSSDDGSLGLSDGDEASAIEVIENSDDEWAFVPDEENTMQKDKFQRVYDAHGIGIQNLDNLTLMGDLSFDSVAESKVVNDVKRSHRKKLNRQKPTKPIQMVELDLTGSCQHSDDSATDYDSPLESEDEESMEYNIPIIFH